MKKSEADVRTSVSFAALCFSLLLVGVGPLPVPPAPPREADADMMISVVTVPTLRLIKIYHLKPAKFMEKCPIIESVCLSKLPRLRKELPNPWQYALMKHAAADGFSPARSILSLDRQSSSVA